MLVIWVEWGSQVPPGKRAEVVGSASSREAGLGASLHSKSSGPGFGFSVPSSVTLGIEAISE